MITMKQKTQQESVRFVQFLLNPHLINRFLAFAAPISLFACASSVESMEVRPITLFAEYPIVAESLESARPYLLKGDGEGLYGLALKNEAALKQRLDAEVQSNRGTFCEGCGDSCRRTLQQRMKGLTDERNQAQMKLLRLRLDALQLRLEEFHRKQDIKSDLAEFKRHRLLVESVAEQRLESIQDYYLKALTACADIAAPKEHWFLPYYTAYFKLSRILPESVRSYL